MKLNKYIDHTLLKADAQKAAILQLIQEAKDYDFASVCLNPSWVALAAEELAGTDVKVCTVIGFPLGATTPATKAFETAEAVKNGADEVDMVMNIAALKDGDDATVLKDIQAVVEASGDAVVKVIIETALLTDEEKVKACQLAKEAGADFVKTSTGFSRAGAKTEDVKLMRSVVGTTMGVKASGGIRDKETAEAMVKAGADRLGTSATTVICI